jgi:hypothetical protein
MRKEGSLLFVMDQGRGHRNASVKEMEMVEKGVRPRFLHT